MQHIINRQTFELTCRSEDAAKAVQSEVENFVTAPFAEVISAVLTDLQIDAEHFFIDKLEIDLGDVEAGELETVFIQQKFRRLLEDGLKKHTGNAKAIQGSKGTDSELLRHWIRHGDLPWWAAKKDNLSLSRIVNALIKEDPALFKAMSMEFSVEQLEARLSAMLPIATLKKIESIEPSLSRSALSAAMTEHIFSVRVSEQAEKWLKDQLRKHKRKRSHVLTEHEEKILFKRILQGQIKSPGVTASVSRLKELYDKLSAIEKDFVLVLLQAEMSGCSADNGANKKYTMHAKTLKKSVMIDARSTNNEISEPIAAASENEVLNQLLPEEAFLHAWSKWQPGLMSGSADVPGDPLLASETDDKINTTESQDSSARSEIAPGEVASPDGFKENTRDIEVTRKGKSGNPLPGFSNSKNIDSGDNLIKLLQQIKQELSLISMHQISDYLNRSAAGLPSKENSTARPENPPGPTSGPGRKFDDRSTLLSSDSERRSLLPTLDSDKKAGSLRQETIPNITTENKSKLIKALINKLQITGPVINSFLNVFSEEKLAKIIEQLNRKQSSQRSLKKDVNRFLRLYPAQITFTLLKHYQAALMPESKKGNNKNAPYALTATELFVFKNIDPAKPVSDPAEIKLSNKLLQQLPQEARSFVSFLSEIKPDNLSEKLPFTEENIVNMPNIAAEASGKIYIENAGLCLITAYLGGCFRSLGYTANGKFINRQKTEKAVQLIQFIASGEKYTAEYQLQLNKLFCGLSATEVLQPKIRLTKKETAEAEQLLEAVLEHWKTLKSTSTDGFRSSFLQRQGILEEDDQKWTLRVERQGFDMLLNTIPWGYTLIKLPWMKKHLQVEW